MQMEDDDLQPPKPLPWYPNKLGWHMSFTRQQLRKTPILGEIHEFLVRANDHGSISRQEAVSMVPPLFLDVQPHHAVRQHEPPPMHALGSPTHNSLHKPSRSTSARTLTHTPSQTFSHSFSLSPHSSSLSLDQVLDMCAAPGSKTQQLLEALHSGDSVPTGFVVANDADFKRCNLLTHQTKKVCSPCLLVTNHSAEMMPSVMITGAGGKVSGDQTQFWGIEGL